MSEKKQIPDPPEILKERDRLIMRIGNSEVVQTKEGITFQVRCTTCNKAKEAI